MSPSQPPFSLKQAERICKEFQHLVGKPLHARADLREPILHVVTGPWDDLNKWIFLEHLNETADTDAAMSFYKPPYYDVMLVARLPNDAGYYYVTIRNYCTQNGIRFNIEDYATVNDPVIKWKANLPEK
jgi:hypothetical protein